MKNNVIQYIFMKLPKENTRDFLNQTFGEIFVKKYNENFLKDLLSVYLTDNKNDNEFDDFSLTFQQNFPIYFTRADADITFAIR